jgi:assimilatory nitrate reductase catalytic subunit
MGYGQAFDWQSPAEIFAEHAALSGAKNHGTRDFDISAYAGISKDEYENLQPFQWPQAAGQGRRETRFFGNGNFFTPDKKARAIAVYAPEPKSTHGLFTLNTGRVRDHWHTMTRTGKSAKLSAHVAEPFCEIHPNDAKTLHVEDATLVTLSNERGSLVLRALITPRQRKGAVFAPMHWSDQNAANARIDRLVAPDVDPISGQPALKASLVSIKPFTPSVYGFGVSSFEPQPHDLPYFAKAIANDGWRLEFAFGNAPESIEAILRAMLCVDETAELIAYHDRALGQQRFAFFKGDKLIAAVFLSRSPVSVSRASTVADLARNFANRQQRFSVIATRPGADIPDPGAQICACFSVGANQIAAAIQAGCATIQAIGKATSAGTNCGSCKAEIRSILAATPKKITDDDHRLLAAE